VAQKSQPPAPTPPKPAQNDKSKATREQTEKQHDQSGANLISAAINKLTSEVASRKKQDDSTDQKTDASTDRWIMWSTVVTAVSTFFIAVLAYRQWRTLEQHREVFAGQAASIAAAVTQAEIAAKAAKRSADALINSERAWVVMIVDPPSFVLTGSRPSFSFDIINGGKTVARLVNPFVRRFQVLSYEEELPLVPTFEQATVIDTTEDPTEGRLFAPGEHNGTVSFEDHTIPGSQLAEVGTGIRTLYVYGKFNYFDFADVLREVFFCYRYIRSATKPQWVRGGPPAYNKHT